MTFSANFCLLWTLNDLSPGIQEITSSKPFSFASSSNRWSFQGNWSLWYSTSSTSLVGVSWDLEETSDDDIVGVGEKQNSVGNFCSFLVGQDYESTNELSLGDPTRKSIGAHWSLLVGFLLCLRSIDILLVKRRIPKNRFDILRRTTCSGPFANRTNT